MRRQCLKRAVVSWCSAGLLSGLVCATAHAEMGSSTKLAAWAELPVIAFDRKVNTEKNDDNPGAKKVITHSSEFKTQAALPNVKFGFGPYRASMTLTTEPFSMVQLGYALNPELELGLRLGYSQSWVSETTETPTTAKVGAYVENFLDLAEGQRLRLRGSVDYGYVSSQKTTSVLAVPPQAAGATTPAVTPVPVDVTQDLVEHHMVANVGVDYVLQLAKNLEYVAGVSVGYDYANATGSVAANAASGVVAVKSKGTLDEMNLSVNLATLRLSI